MRALLVIALVAAACSGRGPQVVGSQPSWREKPKASSQAQTVTFAPSSEAVIRYNDPVEAPPNTALGTAIAAAVREAAVRAKTPVPVADARLFRACAELAHIAPEEGMIAYSLIEFALQRNGIIEPSPNLLVAWGDLDSPQSIIEQLQPRLAELLADGATARLGIGAAKRTPDGTGAVVFALQASGVKTSPIPRSVAAGGSFVLEATVAPSFRNPEVFVTRIDGTVDRLELKRGLEGAFAARVQCGPKNGKQQIEITASDAQGSSVLANFPVWCGAQPPQSVTVEASHDDVPVSDPLEAERRVLALVNRDRQAAGLAPFHWDERVAAVARGHSEDMHQQKIVAHVLPSTGSAADRVRAAKIKTAVVLENVARAYSLGEAHQGLMNSPGHRANLLSGLATHIGIGIVFGGEVAGRREVFVTQVFTRVPPKVDPPKAAEAVRKRIAAVRPISNDAALSAIAQALADSLAAGQSRDEAYAPLKRRVEALSSQYARIGSIITAAVDVDTLDGASLLGDATPDAFGVGIGQGTHAELGDGAVFVVVLLATKQPGR